MYKDGVQAGHPSPRARRIVWTTVALWFVAVAANHFFRFIHFGP